MTLLTPQALDTSQAKTLGIGVIIALLVVGAIISALITAIVARIVVLVVVVALAVVVWTQRADIESAAKKCDATFFGVHLTPSNAELKKKCQEVAN
ncbi:MAG: hypothetical protein ACR2KJ_14665 [Jatrophihabitans sp.]